MKILVSLRLNSNLILKRCFITYLLKIIMSKPMLSIVTSRRLLGCSVSMKGLVATKEEVVLFSFGIGILLNNLN